MASTPPNRMSIEDDIADPPFVHMLSRKDASRKESAHLSHGLFRCVLGR
jgi:hypothetical protein